MQLEGHTVCPWELSSLWGIYRGEAVQQQSVRVAPLTKNPKQSQQDLREVLGPPAANQGSPCGRAEADSMDARRFITEPVLSSIVSTGNSACWSLHRCSRWDETQRKAFVLQCKALFHFQPLFSLTVQSWCQYLPTPYWAIDHCSPLQSSKQPEREEMVTIFLLLYSQSLELQ